MSRENELEELRRIFVTEAEEHLGVLEEALMGLEARPDDPEGLRASFRAIHTIKGSASLVDLDAVEAVAHRSEDILAALREGEAPVTGEVVSLLLRSVDALRSMTQTVAAGGAPDAGPFADIGAELTAWRPGGTVPAPAASSAAAGPAAPSAPRRSLRVDVAKLDRLLEITTEIVLGRRTFGGLLQILTGAGRRPLDGTGHRALAAAARPPLGDSSRPASDRAALRELREAFEDDWSLYDELREAVMEMRTVPVGPTLRRFARPMRDAAADSGKKVRLVVEGEDVEVDTSVVEQLVDPLTHLVRNAVDHGIELPAVRTEAGKDPAGTIRLTARRDPASLVIEVADDGAGLSSDGIVARARQRGISRPEKLSDPELRDLLFQPGFSTAERISDLSGRGVGLDIVRRTVEGLRGSVELASRQGAGTTVTLRAPLTLSVVDGLEVQVGDGTFVVPLENTTTCMDAPEALDADDGVLELDGQALPWVRLRRLFATPGEPPAREQMVLVRHGSLRAALVVDRLLGEADATVRSLGAGLDVARLGGSTVLRDGRIGLLLDVPVLLRELASGALHRASLFPTSDLH